MAWIFCMTFAKLLIKSGIDSGIFFILLNIEIVVTRSISIKESQQ